MVAVAYCLTQTLGRSTPNLKTLFPKPSALGRTCKCSLLRVVRWPGAVGKAACAPVPLSKELLMCKRAMSTSVIVTVHNLWAQPCKRAVLTRHDTWHVHSPTRTCSASMPYLFSSVSVTPVHFLERIGAQPAGLGMVCFRQKHESGDAQQTCACQGQVEHQGGGG